MFSVRRKGYINMDMEYFENERIRRFKMQQEEGRISDYDRRWWTRILLRLHQVNTTPSWEPKFWSKYFPFPLFPTYRHFAQSMCILIVMLLVWGTAWSVLGETLEPGGQLFQISCLVVCAYLAGYLWNIITTLPGLIAMLFTGILFQNLGWVDINGSYIKLSSDLRKVALVVILMRAGLGLNLDTIKNHYVTIVKLGLIPWFVEGVTFAIATHFALDLPWIWSFLLGSMTASVSPAVVVPCLLRLGEEGYGVRKGIPTLVLAAAAIDDSISVATFLIIFTAIFSTGSLAWTIIKGPLSIVLGISFGVMSGCIASFIPEKHDEYNIILRFIYVFTVGMFSLFVSNNIQLGGAGPLAVVSCGFTAALCWCKDGWPINKNPVSNAFRIIWIVFEPILFALTGAQVKINLLDVNVLNIGLACLCVCLLIRIVATFLVSFNCGLNNKEKLFIGITWLSKATVQAALGPLALDYIREQPTNNPSQSDVKYAETVLTISILSVVLAAPIGAILIALLGPTLLTKDDVNAELEIDGTSNIESSLNNSL